MRGKLGSLGRSLSVGRSFESAVTARQTPEERGGAFFERLLRLTIRHDYYNDSRGLAPDYTIRPTHFTRDRMLSLGLRFLPEESGFSVLYNVQREKLLLSYLKRNAQSDGNGAWFRLSFVAALRNPFFLNFTDMDIGCNPATRNYYYTNAGLPLKYQEPWELKPQGPWEVVPVQIPYPVPLEVAAVEILNVGGEVVQCKPRCVPEEVLAKVSVADARCCDVEYLSTWCRNDTVYLDFGLLPEDKYEIREIDESGQPLGESLPVLFTETFPQPFFFLDLLLHRPGPGIPMYPLQPPGSSGEKPKEPYPVNRDFTEICFRSYRIDYSARSTVWRYWIVPRPQAKLEEVEIEQVEGPYPVTFTEAQKVPLAGGGWAYRMESQPEMVLRQDSPWCLRLTARRDDSTLQLDRLPVASIEQVRPELSADGNDDPSVQRVNYSDIYVVI